MISADIDTAEQSRTVTCDCGDLVAPESESVLGYTPEPVPVPETISAGGGLRGLMGVWGILLSRICLFRRINKS
jgi:hypothetical protein